MVSARELVGRSIVAFRPNPSPDGPRGTVAHDPEIELDDGSVLYFVVEELEEGGDYGVYIGRRRAVAREEGRP